MQDAKKRHLPWTEIAEMVARTIGPESGLAPNRRAQWLREAAKLSGYTPAVLRRFANTLAFVEGFDDRARPDSEVIQRSFTAIEMIHRIARQDSDEASRLFAGLGRSGMAISELRRVLKDSRDRRLGRSLGQLKGAIARPAKLPLFMLHASPASERNWRIDAAMSALQRWLPELTGRFLHFGRPGGTAPPSVRCDAIAWLAGWTRGDGYEIVHAPVGAAKSLVSDRVARAVVGARFFRRFYLIFTPDSSEELAMRARQALDQLEARSVGIIFLGAKQPVMRKRTGPPDPDWSHLLPTVCPGGKWNEHFAPPSAKR